MWNSSDGAKEGARLRVFTARRGNGLDDELFFCLAHPLLKGPASADLSTAASCSFHNGFGRSSGRIGRSCPRHGALDCVLELPDVAGHKIVSARDRFRGQPH